MVDPSKYVEVKTMQFDHSQYGQLQELNKFLKEGWELIDAKVGQWASAHREEGKVIGFSAAPGYCFILGRPK